MVLTRLTTPFRGRPTRPVFQVGAGPIRDEGGGGYFNKLNSFIILQKKPTDPEVGDGTFTAIN